MSETLTNAIQAIDGEDDSVIAVSRFFKTPCFPKGAGPDYVNAVIALQTGRSPRELMDRLHRIEAEFGRERQVRWGQRSLDLDLLAFGQLVLPDDETYKNWVDLPQETQQLRAPEQLILPHPRMHERAFVLIPLLDIAPDWLHPVFGKTVREMAATLSSGEKTAVIPV